MKTTIRTDPTSRPEKSQSAIPSAPIPPRPRGRGRRWLLLAVPIAVGCLSLGVARAQHLGGAFHGGRGGGAFMQERIEHLLTAAGASDAQKAQVKSIWDGLRPQLKPLHQQHAALRKQMADAMTAPSIDTGNIEQLRQQSVATMDKISRVVTQGIVASAQVLTPDQRKIVLQKIEEHRHHGRDGGE